MAAIFLCNPSYLIEAEFSLASYGYNISLFQSIAVGNHIFSIHKNFSSLDQGNHTASGRGKGQSDHTVQTDRRNRSSNRLQFYRRKFFLLQQQFRNDRGVPDSAQFFQKERSQCFMAKYISFLVLPEYLRFYFAQCQDSESPRDNLCGSVFQQTWQQKVSGRYRKADNRAERKKHQG